MFLLVAAWELGRPPSCNRSDVFQGGPNQYEGMKITLTKEGIRGFIDGCVERMLEML